jgi:hypothetical protein
MVAGRNLKIAGAALALATVLATARAGRAAPPVATPQQLADRVVDFADEGCDYLKGLKRRPNKPLDEGSRRQAAHFGRILGQEPRGDGTDYRVSLSLFPGWQAHYWLQSLTLAPPATETIMLGHFEKRLGKGEGTPGGAGGGTDFVFRAGPGHLGCDVTVSVGAEQRVTAFKFAREPPPPPK